MKVETIVKKLIHTYPNSISITIAYNKWPQLNFVETVDNFAENIMNDFDENMQKYHFGQVFENKDQCVRFLATYMHSINELCQDWIDENYYAEDGELYSYAEESEDD